MNKAEIARLLDREYAEKRLRAEDAQGVRIAEIEAAYPEIANLRAEIRENQFEMARHRLQGTNPSALSAEIQEKKRRIDDILREAGHPSDALEPWYICTICQDTGYVGDGLLYPCACRKARLYELLYPNLHTDGKQSFESFDVSVFSDEGARSPRRQMQAAREKAETYADTFPHTEKPNILILGHSGLGKTYLANCICKRIADRGKSVISITSYVLSDLFRNRHMGMGDLDDLIGCSLLAIDDLGAEPLFNNVTVEYLFSLYNQRLIKGKHTITISNFSLDELRSRYTERIVSRLTDKARTCIWQFVGNDVRNRK